MMSTTQDTQTQGHASPAKPEIQAFVSVQSPDHAPLSALLDISLMDGSAQAMELLDELLARRKGLIPTPFVNINLGGLVFTPKLVSKLRNLVQQAGYKLEAVFTTVPQTQQAALDEGLYVKTQPITISTLDLTEALPAPATETKPEGPHLLAGMDEQSLNEQKRLLSTPTLLLKRSLRSGKVLKHDGNLVIVGDVHAGSEVVATGDIVVWGEVRGIVHAGASGNLNAEIRAMRLEALQIRIADVLARRPDKLYYHKPGDNAIQPELACIVDGEIKIFKDRFERIS
jgi:septum site-determining protein MinC